MTFAASQNLPDALDRAAAIYRAGLAGVAPAPTGRAAERSRHFAAAARLAVLEPAQMARLHVATLRVRTASSLTELLPAVLDAALELTGADFGDLQLVDPATTALRMVTCSGFDDDLVQRYAVVDDERYPCGLAARHRRQIGTLDLPADPALAAEQVGDVAAVLATPMLDFAGNLVGVVSTHYRRPELPDAVSARLVELLADLAGERLAADLGGRNRSDRSERSELSERRAGDDADLALIARAMLSALLAPDAAPRVTGHRSTDRADPDLLHRPFRDAFPADEVSEIADLVVTRLFAVGLQLDSARSVLTDRRAVERLSAAAADIEALIDTIRTAMISRAARRKAPRTAG